MNPFLPVPVAAPTEPLPYSVLRRPVRRLWSERSRSAADSLPIVRRRWVRVLGRVAVASGLALIAMPAHALDANVATIEQLEAINGVGPRTAKIIVQERERAGLFESLEDLSDRVRGIGRKRLGRLRAAGLTVGAGVTVLSPNSIAMPQFAPSLPQATPIAP
ncbi:ComEA family DNA-binding protein [Bordetella muralis]|uniref:ComEA family DNA-binding protein n=1 Tax=Bordetella muralis TaxID=1649130 RepID=UPI0039EED486